MQQTQETKDLIEELRKVNRNLSYEKIAKEMGVSSQSVYRWLRGVSNPNQLAIKAISDYVSEAK